MADTPITDDYVAEILQRDAKRNGQSRYLASGFGSLLGARSRDKNAPKPNTRFLKNLVRDADSHNAALKRKEVEDSRARLRGLRHEEQKSRHRERSLERDDDRRRRRREGLSPREKDLKRSRHRSRSPERRREHRRSRSSERESARSRRDRGHEPRRRERSRNIEYEASDSDPLESVIGPKPPPKIKSRGRGADKDSTMDSRFDPNYDPKEDVALDNSDDDDWDMALEALRDRAKWRKSGAERLRAAGFTEDEVSKWERGGGSRADGEEKDISDVRWSNKGEGREWDRGKFTDGGRVDVKADWGRLKDT